MPRQKLLITNAELLSSLGRTNDVLVSHGIVTSIGDIKNAEDIFGMRRKSQRTKGHAFVRLCRGL